MTDATVNAIADISLNKNLFATGSTIKGFGISTVSKKAGTKVNEIGIFAVDDNTGKIGGIAPGTAGYLKAVSNSARSIFSALDGNFFDNTKVEIALDPNKIYGFFEVQDGSISEVQRQIANGQTPTNVLSFFPDANGNSPIKITANSENNGYNVSINNDELVLNVVKLDGTPNIAIGSKSQGFAQGRTIDLTDFAGKMLKADITTKSSSGYNNHIGFYVVQDELGSIQLNDGTTVRPGEANYSIEAVKNAILQANKTDSKLGQDLVGGKIYAPVVVSGTFGDFLSKNPTNGGGEKDIHAYFSYIGGNSDKTDHFRLLGNNTFGVEDMYGGGDRDFNDLVVNVNVKMV